ncbi:MAG: hypothetical protein ACE5NA_13230 [Nitrospiraceae bacterium]
MKKSLITKRSRKLALPNNGRSSTVLRNLVWRVARLERQVQTLSELVRSHAEDADRLVQIVAENRDLLRHDLLEQHRLELRARKRLRAVGTRLGLTRLRSDPAS